MFSTMTTKCQEQQFGSVANTKKKLVRGTTDDKLSLIVGQKTTSRISWKLAPAHVIVASS